MSFLERQQAAFSGSLASAAAKMSSSTKRPLAPPSPSPSVASTTSVAPAGTTPTKGKKSRDAGGVIYSQPENTGLGNELATQMVYAVQHLKERDRPLKLDDILDHLSATRQPESFQVSIMERLRASPSVQWIPDPNLSEQTWKSGTYVHRPKIPGVKSKTQLLAYLQSLADAKGVEVKDLKDGWKDADQGIADLEREHRVLVVRAKKDGTARWVWPNDPTLCHTVDPEFRNMWHKVEVPSVDDIVRRLTQVGQKPTSEDPRLKISNAPKVKKEKKRAVRRSGKTTNTHMEHLLKDFAPKR
ncbi:Transcription initiation factor IIE subunit beta [Pleurostoma richardsiae]|uniref:Transcription initiation factor IIE subunit beta n=1 Tax=Pleurostoma richardsiae TaxID=41990 RepID=A0AA38RLW6_9PEZI|nr:Transcription initiation factor IIE subunit beta [Pleurostoma richardsiae]